MCRAALIVAIAFGYAPDARAGEELSTFIDRTIAEYGGAPALQKATVVRAVGQVSSTARGGKAGSMTRLFAWPMRLRVEVSWGGADREVRVLDGMKGWRDGVQVEGPPLEAMLLQAARLELPLSLLDRKALVKDLGTVDRDGTHVRILELPLSATMSVTAEVDADSHRLIRSIGRAKEKVPIEFVTAYFDYRKVDGVLVAFTERNVAMGRPTGDTTFEKVELLAEPPKGAFRP